MIVVDHHSKYAVFITTPTDCNVDKIAHLFIKHIVKLWAVLKAIMSDQDP